MKKLIRGISILILAVSCTNINKLIDRGEYDQAIDKLTSKLEGKKDKKKEYVLELEYAFQKAQERDLKTEKNLRDENQNENWSKIYSIHNLISERQSKIEPFLPLVSKDGYQATFKFINVDELRKESKKNTAEFYYQSALTLIEEARRTLDKNAARQASDYLTKIDALFSLYKDKEQLKKIAYDLALENYLVKITNNTNNIIPENIESELLRVSIEGLNKPFKHFDVVSNPSVQYDHYIVMHLTQMEFSPERERTRVYDDINEIEKEEIIKDNKGRPRKDSLGNEMKEKVKTKYTSTIEETTQSKSLALGGTLEYIHALSGNIEYTKPIQVEGVFENRYAKLIIGDRNTVTDDCRKKLNGRIMSFPSNESLLLDASDKMKVIVKKIIKDREN